MMGMVTLMHNCEFCLAFMTFISGRDPYCNEVIDTDLGCMCVGSCCGRPSARAIPGAGHAKGGRAGRRATAGRGHEREHAPLLPHQGHHRPRQPHRPQAVAAAAAAGGGGASIGPPPGPRARRPRQHGPAGRDKGDVRAKGGEPSPSPLGLSGPCTADFSASLLCHAFSHIYEFQSWPARSKDAYAAQVSALGQCLHRIGTGQTQSSGVLSTAAFCRVVALVESTMEL